MLHAYLAVVAVAFSASPPPAAEGEVPPLERSHSLEEEDIDPSIAVVRSEVLDVRLGGLVQVHAVPWAGPDAHLENEDVATRPGFRMRRARLGVEASFYRKLRLLVAVNPLEHDDEVGTLADGRLTYEHCACFALTVGTGKVPLSRSALTSSRHLLGIERPLSVTAITPSQRLGVSAEGEVLSGRLAYLVSAMNGTEGFGAGNRFGGLLYGARVEGAVWGRIDLRRPFQTNLGLGLSALQQRTPGFEGQAYSADLVATFKGFSLQIEGLLDRRAPLDEPVVSPDLPSVVQRAGAYAELGYMFLIPSPVQVMARAEWFDDDRAHQNTGDGLLFEAGVNASIFEEHARAQLHYIARRERFGGERQNDAVVLSMQGSF